MLWSGDIDEFERRSHTILRSANRMNESNHHYPKLIQECFSTRSLEQLDKLRHAWLETQDDSSASELTWLAITSILRLSASAGTAQWQYILPRQKKQKTIEPFAAFQAQISMMIDDMTEMQASSAKSMSILVEADARHCPELRTNSADLVITSPPYANNYDYADATRFEMSFWGEVESWADLHQAVRQYLIVSSSQHASKERLELDSLLEKDVIAPIHSGLSIVCSKLAKERLEHGGKKHYHTMVAAYFIDLANVWNELRRICKPGATVCYVIGDSAPYGIYVPVDEWLGRLAVAAGFRDFRFEKLRDRNIKWKNRKHRVPLKEGRLWING
jgi:hypothetical protein